MSGRTRTDGTHMPAHLRLPLLGVVGALILGGLYLVAVRGSALLLDLSALAALCF